MATPTGAYQLIRAAVATSTAITLNQVWIPAGTAVEVVRAYANQGSSTTSGGAEFDLVNQTSAATVTSQAATAAGPNTVASRCVNGTTSTGITSTIAGTAGNKIDNAGVNVLNGYLYFPVPEARPILLGSAARGVNLRTVTTLTSVNLISGIDWLEY